MARQKITHVVEALPKANVLLLPREARREGRRILDRPIERISERDAVLPERIGDCSSGLTSQLSVAFG